MAAQSTSASPVEQNVARISHGVDWGLMLVILAACYVHCVLQNLDFIWGNRETEEKKVS